MSSTTPARQLPGGLADQPAPPLVETSAGLPHEVVDAEVWAYPVLPGDDDLAVFLGPGAAEAAEVLDLDLLAALETARATGAAGEVTTVPTPRALVLLVGVGDAGRADLRRAGAALGRAVRGRGTVASTVGAPAADGPDAFVAGVVLSSFVLHFGIRPPEHLPVARVVLADTPAQQEPAVDAAVAKARASWLARALATVPSNIKSPAWLADQATAVAQVAGLDVEVWDEDRLAEEGFGGVLAVGSGSATPPRFIRLDYTPERATRKTPTVVLVGKGITFDSGGLSIKPAESMATMKRDMTGGAVVIATLAALRAVDCPVRVVGLVPAAENAIGASAMRPGDVIRHHGGRTTEVTNTDAEGRLVLADALHWATSTLAPAAVVDIATLTGALKVALGLHTGGYFADDDALAAAIATAAASSGEALWRMPLAGVYEEKLASKVADADNAPGGPGAITAALFLQHFTSGVPWVHLDIAPVGDTTTERDEWTAGPSGFGVRMLLDWLGSAEPLAGVR